MTEALLTAFLLGLLSSLHCGGMCGGISGALSLSLPSRAHDQRVIMFGYQLLFNLGRISSYMLVGALFGLLTIALPDEQFASWLGYGRVAVGILMMLLALHLTGLLRTMSALERVGVRIWRKLAPLYKPFMPVKKFRHALIVGMFWGWLPCGLVYAALAFSLTVPGPGQSALVMGAFGLGTLPALLLTGSGIFILMRKLPKTQLVMGLLLLALGGWTAYAGLVSVGGEQHGVESPRHH